jgi:nitroreductase
MEFKDALQKKRSVRSYRNEPIEPATIESLIDVAILAPSAINGQPWGFWVVLGRERVDDFSDRAKNWLVEKFAHDPTAVAVHQRLHLAPPDLSLLYHAPAMVLVVAKSFEKQADEDCCLAASSLMLAARDAGLGTCWIGSTRPWFNLPATKKELGIPESASVVAPIVLGYPKEWPEAQGRNPAAIHWVR